MTTQAPSVDTLCSKIARMKHTLRRAALACAVLALPTLVLTQSAPADGVSARARQIHDRAIVIDSHDDTTQRMLFDKTFDITTRHQNGNIDVPRMREGGLDGLFFSIWVPSDITGAPAVKRAMDLIDAVHKAATAHPNDLTPFGKDVVRELNKLGVMVDISHVSDKTFYDALAVTSAPVIASHSSCRAIANHPRNMTDDMIRALAKNGGVMMINYHAAFLSEEFRVASEKKSGNVVASMAAMSKKCGGNEACTTMESERIDHEAMAKGELPKVSWEKIIEHIDHAVKVGGADHVGLGSDFDGATMPIGMEDVSKLPRITDALLKKGYSDQDIEKILGGNILRVMEQVDKLKSA